MERKQIVSRLGMGMRVLIVRPLLFGRGNRPMVLQVEGPGWRTVSAYPVAAIPSSHGTQATQWMYDYDERPQGTFRRYP